MVPVPTPARSAISGTATPCTPSSANTSSAARRMASRFGSFTGMTAAREVRMLIPSNYYDVQLNASYDPVGTLGATYPETCSTVHPPRLCLARCCSALARDLWVVPLTQLTQLTTCPQSTRPPPRATAQPPRLRSAPPKPAQLQRLQGMRAPTQAHLPTPRRP